MPNASRTNVLQFGIWSLLTATTAAAAWLATFRSTPFVWIGLYVVAYFAALVLFRRLLRG